MKRFLGVIVLIVFVLGGAVRAETMDGQVSIPISIDVPGTFTFDVTSINLATGAESAIGSPTVGFSTSGVTLASPWKIANDAVRIRYSSNYGEWGVTFSTNNLADIPGTVPAYTHPGSDGFYGREAGAPANAKDDNACSYSGLINEAMKDDPSIRAILGWQAFNMNANGTLPYTDPTNAALGIVDDNNDGTTQVHEISDTWNADWRYVADISNTTYNSTTDALDPYNVADIYDLVPADDLYNYSYSIYGFANGRSLLPAKVSDANNTTQASGDVAVYLAAKFGGTSYDTNGNTINFVLPAGHYETTVKVKMIHL